MRKVKFYEIYAVENPTEQETVPADEYFLQGNAIVFTAPVKHIGSIELANPAREVVAIYSLHNIVSIYPNYGD